MAIYNSYLYFLFYCLFFYKKNKDFPPLLRGCLVICGGTDRCVVDELGVIPIHYLKTRGPYSVVIGCKSRVPATLRFPLAEIAVSCNIYFQNYLNYQIYKMEHFL